jgi:beta-aspartyl-peptidase (threonine type)
MKFNKLNRLKVKLKAKKNLLQGKTQIRRIPFALAIHGGAGNYDKDQLPASIRKGKEKGLGQALEAGYQILQKGGSSLDAVQAAVVVLEDSEFFNAGKGAVLTQDQTVELDASLMSSDFCVGAVGGLKATKNPILLARQIMEKTPFVFLIGKEADKFAAQQGLQKVPNRYFITDRRLKEWQKTDKAAKNKPLEGAEWGTVGAVALDQRGQLAAATSTGGINYKMAGRVGDASVIGAGTYATEFCAVSCTGQGEAFIKKSIASFVCQLVRFGVSLDEAAFRAIFEELASVDGQGGLIAIDHFGRCVMPFSTLSMSRGYWQADGKPMIFLD